MKKHSIANSLLTRSMEDVSSSSSHSLSFHRKSIDTRCSPYEDNPPCIPAGINLLYNNDEKKIFEYYRLPSNKEKIIPLQPEFNDEHWHELFKIEKYFTFEARAIFQVVSYNGQFCYPEQETEFLHGEYIYVLLPNNCMYATPHLETHHSYLAAGLPVKAAGHAFFEQGYLMVVSNNSGHYKPTKDKILPGIKWLRERTFNDFLFEDHSEYNISLPNGNLKHYRIYSDMDAIFKMSPLNKQQINIHLTQAVKFVKIQQAKQEEREDSKQRTEEVLKERKNILFSSLALGYENCFSSMLGQCTHNSLTSSQEVDLSLKYTGIKDYKEGVSSRFKSGLKKLGT